MIPILLALLPPFTATPEDYNVRRAVWAPDGEAVALCGETGVVLARRDGATARVLGGEPGCVDVAFDEAGLLIVLGEAREGSTLWRWAGGALAPVPTPALAQAVWAGEGTRLVATTDAVVRLGGEGAAPVAGVRRLAPAGAGFLAVTRAEVVLLDAKLGVTRRLAPDHVAPNGLVDAAQAASGVVVVLDHGGDLRAYGPDGALLAHHAEATRGQTLSLVPGEARVVAGDDHFRLPDLAPLARRRAAAPARGPVAVGPAALAVVVGGGVRFDPLALPPPLALRGLPSGGRGLVLGGDLLTAATDAGQLLTFDVANGRLVRAVEASRDAFRVLVADAGGTLYGGTEWGGVVVVPPDGVVRRWPIPGAGISGLALAADGGALFVGATRGVYRLALPAGPVTPVLEEPEQHDFTVSLAPGGDVLAGAATKAWRLAPDGSKQTPLPVAGPVAVHDGLLWGQHRRQITVQTWASRVPVTTLDEPASDAWLFLPGGDAIAWGWDGGLRRISLKSGVKWSMRAPWHVGGLAYDPRRDALWTVGPDRVISRWSVADGQRVPALPPATGQAVEGLAFTPDGRHLVVGDDRGGLRLWDVATLSPARQVAYADMGALTVATAGAAVLAFLDDGRGFVLPGDGVPTLVPAEPPALFRAPQAFAPAADRGVRASEGELALFRLHDLHPEGIIGAVEGDVRVLALSPDARWLAVALRDREVVQVFDVNARKAGPRVQVTDVWALAWQGADLLIGTESGLQRWTPGRPLGPTISPVTGDQIAVHADGVIVTDGQAVHVLDPGLVPRGAALADAFGAEVVALSPDGRTLATAGRGGTITLWDVATRHATARITAYADGRWQVTTATGTTEGRGVPRPGYRKP